METEKLIDRIELETLAPAPITRTWEFLTTSEYVKMWYAFDGAEIDLTVGGRVAFRWKEHGEFLGQVERLNAPQEIAFRFVGHTPGAMPQPGNSTLVEFRLEAIGNETKVALDESGFLGLDNPLEGDVTKAEISLEGWRVGLAALCSLALSSQTSQ